MRKINKHFHIEGEQIIKTSNGQPIPADEPVFILRGRDKLAMNTLWDYWDLADDDGCTEDFKARVREYIAEFEEFASKNPERMKQPGGTMGK
jgi:hypothetical protein